MARVIEPFRAMGAHLDGRAGDTKPPHRRARWRPRRAASTASASPVRRSKTALLLAGLQAAGTTEVVEPAAEP